jgi:activator of Hsp90 ATPase-like protein
MSFAALRGLSFANMGTRRIEMSEPNLGRLTPESVREATGRGWEEWLEVLDAGGAAEWDHKETVAYLEREHPEVSGWWRHALTVGYERARGKRAVGETAAGFQVGVQRSVAATAAEAWDLITARPELWLGEGASVAFEEGQQYEVPPRGGAPGARGEVRVVKPGVRLRMTWQPEGWRAAATLQLTLLESGAGKTAIHAQLEKLPDADAREAMRERWREALDRIAAA